MSSLSTARPTLCIDPERCRTCGKCLAKAACRFQAIRMIDTDEPPIVDTARCAGCQKCRPACPFDAVVYCNTLT